MQKFCRYRSRDGVSPETLFFDLRNPARIEADSKGLAATSLSENLNTYSVRPFIQHCEEMGGPTEPALIHHEILGLIVMCLKPGSDWRKSLVKMYRDQPPFELVDEKFVLF